MKKLNNIDSEQLHALSPERIELSKELFVFLAERLNKLHGTDFSERFWKLITEEYVRSVIIRYSSFNKDALNRTPLFLPHMFGSHVDLKERVRGWLSILRNYVRSRDDRKKMFEALHTHDELLIDFSKDSLITEETGGIPLPSCSLKPALFGGSKKRRVLNKMALEETNILEKNVLLQLPRFLVEHFVSIYESIDLIEPQNKTFHIRGKFQFSYRQIVLAKYAEFGSRIIWYQNGAMVGECKYKYGGYLVRSVADEHRTWGWKMDEVDHPWKAYDLQQFKSRYERGEKGGRDDLLITFPKLWDAEVFYLEMTQKLLQSLDEKHYRSIRIRPYPSWKSGSRAAAFKKISDPRVTVSKFEESMAEEVANSRVVLHINVPATSFLETVSVDHPTTGLLMNEYPTDIVKPYYEDFLSRGVLHTEIESAADHLNNAQIDQWWNAVMGNETYEEFKKLFTGA